MLPREVEAAGDTLYQNFCTVCHGAAGDAKGPVSGRIGAPSLLTGRARGYSDGYLYSIIRYGRGVMPRYGDKVYQPAERWAIVSHVRKLQAASPAPPGAGRRRRGDSTRAERHRIHRRASSMSPGTVHQRLVERSLVGKYGAFMGIGGGCAGLGLILFVMALTGDDAPRAWQLFHVNWLYFTGLAGGSVAFAAVQKITNAKWSGLVIRFAEASVAFLPVSLIGLVLTFTLGYHAVYGPMEAAAHAMPHSKAVWLSWPFMFGRLLVGLSILYWVGWKLIRADLVPDMLATRGVVGPGAARSSSAGPGDTTARLPPRWPRRSASTGWPRSTWCSTRSCSAWWPSTASWRSSRTGSATCSAASTSWARSSGPTCCSP